VTDEHGGEPEPLPAPVAPVPPEHAAPKRPPFAAPAGPREHRWGLGAYALAEVVFLGVSILLSLVVQADTASLIAVVIAVPTLCAAAVALLATRVRGGGPLVDLRLRWSWSDVGVGLGFGVFGLLLTIPASLVYAAVAGPDASSAVGEVFAQVHATPPGAVLVFVVVALLAPACEEIIYRGLLWGALERLGARPWIAFAVTTLLFALAHLELARTPLLLVVAMPIGLARLSTGRLLPSIVAHQVNNLLPAIGLVVAILGS
jgi:uncharacterized protein